MRWHLAITALCIALSAAAAAVAEDGLSCPRISELRAQCALADAFSPALDVPESNSTIDVLRERALQRRHDCIESAKSLRDACSPSKQHNYPQILTSLEDLDRSSAAPKHLEKLLTAAYQADRGRFHLGPDRDENQFQPWHRLSSSRGPSCGTLVAARDACAAAEGLRPLLVSSLSDTLRKPAEAAALSCVQASLDLAGCRASTRAPRSEILAAAAGYVRALAESGTDAPLVRNQNQLDALIARVKSAACSSPRRCADWMSQRASAWRSTQNRENAQLEAQARSQAQLDEIAAKEQIEARLATDRRSKDSALSREVEWGTAKILNKEIAKQGAAVSNAMQSQARATRLNAYALEHGLNELAEAIREMTGAQRKPNDGAPRRQIRAHELIAPLYPKGAAVDYAIVVVPDPRVPRHRRGYDLALNAIDMGMLEQAFVLDRYDMPWQSYLDQAQAAGASTTHNGLSELQADDGRFGLLVYRRDEWRSEGSSGPNPRNLNTSIRALMVVPETATFGIGQKAFSEALRTIQARLLTESIDANSWSWHADPKLGMSRADGANIAGIRQLLPRILVIGPSFSGSLSSMAHAVFKARADWISQINPDRERLLASRLEALLLRLDRRARKPEPESIAFAEQLRILRLPAQRALSDQRISRSELKELSELIPKSLTDREEKPCPTAPFEPEAQGHGDCLLAEHWNPENSQSSGPQVAIRSPATTAESNKSFQHASGLGTALEFDSLAVRDSEKLEFLQRLVFPNVTDIPQKLDVVVLHEASVFGDGLCSSPEPEPEPERICQRAMRFPFPPNISDLRFARRQSDGAVREQLRRYLPFSSSAGVLPMAEGIDNGSEFPDSQRSALTSISVSLQLEQLLQSIERINPRMVIVVATDVRDRLFLFDLVRRRAPRAQLVDLEADTLLSHPEYLHASRGVLMMSSQPLSVSDATKRAQGGESEASSRVATTRYFFATDDQAGFFALANEFASGPTAVSATSTQVEPARGANPHPLLVTRRGPVPIDASTIGESARGIDSPLRQLWGFLLCLQAAALGATLGFWGARSRLLWVFALVAIPMSLAAYDGVVSSLRGHPLMLLSSGLSWPGAFASLLAALSLLLGHWAWRDAREEEKPQESELPKAVTGTYVKPEANAAWRMLAVIALLPLFSQLSIWANIGGPVRTSLLGFKAELSIYLLQWTVCLLALYSVFRGFINLRRTCQLARRLQALAERHCPELLQPWSRLPLLHHSPADLKDSPQQKLHSMLRLPEFAGNPLWTQPESFQAVACYTTSAKPDTRTDVDELELLFQRDSLQLRSRLALVLIRACTHSFAWLRVALLMGFAQIVAGWCYPITGGDGFLLIALLVLLLSGAIFIFALWRLPQYALLDRLLCDGAGRTLLDFQKLLGLLATVGLAVGAWVLIESPGVLDSGGGIFSWLRELLKWA